MRFFVYFSQIIYSYVYSACSLGRKSSRRGYALFLHETPFARDFMTR